MKRRYALLSTFLIGASLLRAPLAHAETQPHVIISEINWAGSSINTSDEWLELTNLDTTDADLSGWVLEGAATSGTNLTIPDGTILPAGATLLVANYPLGTSSTLMTPPDIVTSSLSLRNSDLSIALIDPSGTVIDFIVDPGVPNAGSSNPFASMERLSDGTWATAETSTNLPPDQFGSPGVYGHVVAPTIPDDTTSVVVTEDVTSGDEPVLDPAVDESTPIEDTTIKSGTTDGTDIVLEEENAVDQIDAVDETTTNNVLESETQNDLIETPMLEETTSVVADLKITAFLAAPSSGLNEWIEITNFGTINADLSLYSIVDASGKVTALEGTLTPLATTTIFNPNGKLNNDGDTIRIVAEDGTVLDTIVYGTDVMKKPGSDDVWRLEHGMWTLIPPPVEDRETPNTIEDASLDNTQTTDDTTLTSNLEVDPVVEHVVTEVDLIETSMTNATTQEDATLVEANVGNEIVTPGSDVIEDVAPPSAESTVESEDSVPSLTTNAITPHVIRIAAVLAAPSVGNDEWVELWNTTNAPINLSSLILIDASGAQTVLAGTIAPGATLYILNPKGNLNNSSETITLMQTDGTVIDEVAYGNDEFPAPKKDAEIRFLAVLDVNATEATLSPTMYADETTTDHETTTNTSTANPSQSSSQGSTATTLSSTVVATTTSKPVSSHLTTAKTKSSSSKTSATKKTSSKTTESSPVTMKSVTDIDSLLDDQSVVFEGVVIAQAGVLGKRSFFLDGLEVYQNQGVVLSAHIGDIVRVTGTVSVLADHRRVNIKEGGATILGSTTPTPHSTTETLRYGSLVTVTGVILARDGNAVSLQTHDHQTVTLTPGTGVTIDWPALAGKTITATGIAKPSQDALTVVLRTQDDVSTSDSQDSTLPVLAGTVGNAPRGRSTSLFLGLGAVSLAVLFGGWVWFTRPKPATLLKPLHASS